MVYFDIFENHLRSAAIVLIEAHGCIIADAVAAAKSGKMQMPKDRVVSRCVEKAALVIQHAIALAVGDEVRGRFAGLALYDHRTDQIALVRWPADHRWPSPRMRAAIVHIIAGRPWADDDMRRFRVRQRLARPWIGPFLLQPASGQGERLVFLSGPNAQQFGPMIHRLGGATARPGRSAGVIRPGGIAGRQGRRNAGDELTPKGATCRVSIAGNDAYSAIRTDPKPRHSRKKAAVNIIVPCIATAWASRFSTRRPFP